MRALHLFDPWQSPWCTCKPKYTLDPYTGCAHACRYCYASSYIPRFFSPRPKKDFTRTLLRDVAHADTSIPVSLSNSSDPYQPLENTYRLTRTALSVLTDAGFRIQIVTKSDLCCRDIDLFSSTIVALTITTVNPRTARLLEPHAPSPSRRIAALRTLHDAGIFTVCRVDPLIPSVNDSYEHLYSLCARVADVVDHFVFSTYKARADNFSRMSSVFPHLRTLPFVQRGRTRVLSEEVRNTMISTVHSVVKDLCISASYGFCREGIPPSSSCDGMHLFNFIYQKHVNGTRISSESSKKRN